MTRDCRFGFLIRASYTPPVQSRNQFAPAGAGHLAATIRRPASWNIPSGLQVLPRPQVSYNPTPRGSFIVAKGCGRNPSGSGAGSLVELPKEILRISFFDCNGISCQAFV
jgi:hypothetical protein